MIVLVGEAAEVSVEFDFLDREREFRFAVGICALPDAADLELETPGDFPKIRCVGAFALFE